MSDQLFENAESGVTTCAAHQGSARMRPKERPARPHGGNRCSREQGSGLEATRGRPAFSDWYGANFDALFDCLTDPDWQPEATSS
jgi:hypothetical protein